MAVSYCGRPVDLDRHTARGGPRHDQFERPVPAGVREQPRALADDDRADEQIHLVDELVAEQPAGQGAAAVHLQLTPWLSLQLSDGRREVTGQDGRVRPRRVGERGRCHVLGPRVQRRRDGAGRIGHDSPVTREDVVGKPAEQKRVGALVDLVDVRHGLVVEQRPGPSTALESEPAVLHMQPAVALHHPVDGHLDGRRQFHGRGSLLTGFCVVRSGRR